MIAAQGKRRARGLESPEVLAAWPARCAEALETLDSWEGDALDVATFLRAEHMTGSSE